MKRKRVARSHAPLDIAALKSWREANGVTIQDLADLVGVRWLAAWRWEHRGRQPHPLTLRRIKAAIGSVNYQAHQAHKEKVSDCRWCKAS